MNGKKIWLIQCCKFLKCDPWPATLSSSGNLLEMQVPIPDLLNWKLGVGPNNMCFIFKKFFKDFKNVDHFFLSLYWICYNVASIFFFFFIFWFSCPKASGIFAPWPRIQPVFPALEGKVLTTGLQRKSYNMCFNNHLEGLLKHIL